MLNECIIVLGANQFQRERALIGAEKATNACVVTVSPDVPFHKNKYPSLTIRSRETDPKQLLEDVINFIDATKMKLIGVIPLNDFVLNAGSTISQHFGLPYNEKSTIENCRHKDKMKLILKAANLPVIESHRFSSIDEAIELSNKIGFPLVVKPLNFGGSGGVKKVNYIDELKKATTEAKNHLMKHAKHYDSDSTQMVMETYIRRDREISVEVINTETFRQVIGITEKYLGDEPYFSEIAHLVPSNFYRNKSQFKTINDLAINACQALNIKYGVAHVEIKLFEDCSEPLIIEVGARPAGDGIMDLYEKAMGRNIYKFHCESYLGSLKKEELPKQFFRSAAVAYLHPKSGIISNINRKISDKKDLIHVDSIAISAIQNQEVTTAMNWSTRYGFVEYIFYNQKPQDFDLVKNTNKLAGKIFTTRERND